ncbi:MAG: helix-turn-helix transcriptional regulator [Gammaproteobacteria bacterium]
MTHDYTKELFTIASQFKINHIPGYFNIMTLDSKYVLTNDAAMKLCGFSSQEKVTLQSYENVPCKASESAEIFKQEDQTVIQSRAIKKILSYQCYHDNQWSILLGEKLPIINEFNQVIGTTAHFMDMTNTNLIDLGRYLADLDKNHLTKISKRQFSYTILSEKNMHNLTLRQVECLFFLIRGYSNANIAEQLKLSPRTIEEYINDLKVKFDCDSKALLIEKAIFLGFIAVLPETLVVKSN